MRHLFQFITVLFLCLTSCAQSNNGALAKLKKEVKELNKGLPKEVAFFRMDKIEIKGNDYIVYATLDESQMNFDDYLANMNENKSGVFSMIAQNRQEFADLFVESGLNLKYVITGKQSKRNGEFFISADEIKQAVRADFSIREYMAQLVKSMQDDLPVDWGDGCSLTAIYIEGEYACYRIKTDETVLTIPLLKASKEQGNLMEDSLIESFSNPQDEFEKLIAKCLIGSGYGVRYIFWSEKSPESVTFTITPDVIQSRLGGTSVDATAQST